MKAVRSNKRLRASNPLAALTSLHHQAHSFLPLHPSLPHIHHALVPPNPLPNPAAPADLLASLERRTVDAARADAAALSPSSTDPILDTLPNHGSLWNGHLAQSPVAYKYSETLPLVWKNGAEPPLRARMRKVVDALHGTTLGGRAGVATVREGIQAAIEARAAWEEDVVRRVDEDRRLAEERRRMEQEEQQMDKAFAEELAA